ncbi:hypothetical protein [Streptomyces sp. CA-111067]|uniref:hypothetical protein n=1 Tax=Streptomyces sp. CA-111067 TaxID=3240046 RepID=UPI003D9625E1
MTLSSAPDSLSIDSTACVFILRSTHCRDVLANEGAGSAMRGFSWNALGSSGRSVLSAMTVVLLMGAVAGCAGAGRSAATQVLPSAATAATASVPPASPTNQPSLFLPIAKYSLAADDSLLLDEAVNVLIGHCMARFGFAWTGEKASPVVPGAVQDRRYGLTAATDPAANGYHLPPNPKPSLPKLSADERLALIGPDLMGRTAGATVRFKGRAVPPDGCQGGAQRTMDQGMTTPLPGSAVASDISAQSFEKSQQDPAVRRAFTAWSGCMKAKRFSYPDPLHAGDEFTGKTASAKEKKAAVADVACKRKTNLSRVWFDAETRIQRALIAPKTAVLAPVLARHQQQVARARAILAKG